MSWKTEVHSTILKICAPGQSFVLEDLYRYREDFKKIYPDNNHIDDKIRQTLQYLRNDGIVQFNDDHGSYTLLK